VEWAYGLGCVTHTHTHTRETKQPVFTLFSVNGSLPLSHSWLSINWPIFPRTPWINVFFNQRRA